MEGEKTVLCMDDDADSCELMGIFFEQSDYAATCCSTPEECLEQIKNNDFSAVVPDYRLKDKNGLDACREIKKIKPHIPIAFFTADVLEVTRKAAFEAGADAFLVKPDDLFNLVPVVSDLIGAKN